MLGSAYLNKLTSSILSASYKVIRSHYLRKKSLRPNKKISVFQVTALKILDRVGTNIFFN